MFTLHRNEVNWRLESIKTVQLWEATSPHALRVLREDCVCNSTRDFFILISTSLIVKVGQTTKSFIKKGNFDQNRKLPHTFAVNHIAFAKTSMKLRWKSTCENWNFWKVFFVNTTSAKMKAPFHQTFILLLVNNDIIRRKKYSIFILKTFVS